MLRWALIFFLIALGAAFLGSFGVEGVAMEVGKVLAFIFVILAVISLIGGKSINV